ncbi:MAG: hypothetical protein AAGM40_13990 [Cyanobacteria bacterium J06573_2]
MKKLVHKHNTAKNKRNRQHFVGKILVYIIALTIPFFVLFTSTSSYASVPAYAKLSNIKGSNSIGYRDSKGRFKPAPIGTIIRKFPEMLVLPGGSRTFARIDFYDSFNRHLGIAAILSAKNKQLTHYYFPCSMKGESIIEWSNPESKEAGCEKVIRIKPGTYLDLDTSPQK